MDQGLHPRGGCRRGDGPRPIGLHRLEFLAAALEEDADQVDRRIGAGERGGDGLMVLDRHAERRDLPDVAERLQETRPRRMPHRDADRPAVPGQALDHVAADEAGAAENRRYAAHANPLARPE
jgi:hypothetical protein